MSIRYQLWSWCLLIVSIAASSYSLYSSIHNTWLIAPPLYILLLMSIAALIFGCISFKNRANWRIRAGSWLAVGISSLVTIALLAAMLFTSFFAGHQERVYTSHSPDGNYTIHFYRVDAGAMGTFGIRGELDGPLWFKKRIYYESRIEAVQVEWATNTQVSINNRTLQLDKGETFGYSR